MMPVTYTFEQYCQCQEKYLAELELKKHAYTVLISRSLSICISSLIQ